MNLFCEFIIIIIYNIPIKMIFYSKESIGSSRYILLAL